LPTAHNICCDAAQPAGIVTRFVKVKPHCGEPLNEAADALASAAAAADDSPLPSRLHLATNSVHFYINGAPVEWGARLRYCVIQVAADRAAGELGRPKRRRGGSERPVPKCSLFNGIKHVVCTEALMPNSLINV
jgi:hypothetical protein